MSEQRRWNLDDLLGQINSMKAGMLCWPCIEQARIQPGTKYYDWQAVTVVDGTALCVKHVIARLREEDQRNGRNA